MAAVAELGSLIWPHHTTNIMTTKQKPPRLVPYELIPALRLSQPLPVTGSPGGARVQIVHGEGYSCLGYLVTRWWGMSGVIGIDDYREFSIFTCDLNEATRLASLDEQSLKSAYQMPTPKTDGF